MGKRVKEWTQLRQHYDVLGIRPPRGPAAHRLDEGLVEVDECDDDQDVDDVAAPGFKSIYLGPRRSES